MTTEDYNVPMSDEDSEDDIVENQQCLEIKVRVVFMLN